MSDSAQLLLLRYRRILVVGTHVLLWSASWYGAFLLRFEFKIPAVYLAKMPLWLGIVLVCRIAVHHFMGLFRGLWRYTGSHDAFNLVKAGLVSSLLAVAAHILLGQRDVPRSIYITDALVSVALVAALRLGVRTIREIAAHANTAPRKRVLVVGAGDAAEALVREMRAKMRNTLEPVGFVDDSPTKIGERIHGIPVLGPIAETKQIVEEHRVEEVIVAIPSASGREMRRIVEVVSRADVRVRTMPGVRELIDGRVTANQLREVAIEDLLRRDAVTLEKADISRFLAARTVMVTGAGGSIGSELCRQVASFAPSRLLLVERAEFNLYTIERSLRAQFPDLEIVACLGDIGDRARLDEILSAERPRVIFHAAAHKHVPMLEANPSEAVRNNVLGTKTLADAATRHGVETFVMISTDKAVNATSVMGASKRVAELYCQALSKTSRTRFVTVRFGNVLGSAGSVVPLFKEQIARGGPVTVTHPEMVRFFMTIPEAAQLVMQAGSMGQGGEIFVLDMGEPVRVVDLAQDLIRLSGLTPGEDIEIAFSGVRPGEKLFEELSFDEETALKTRHPKIYVGRASPKALSVVEEGIRHLESAVTTRSSSAIRAAFLFLVPEFTGAGAESSSSERVVPAHEPVLH